MLGSIGAAIGSAVAGNLLNKSQQKAELNSQKEMAGLNFEQQKWMAGNKHQLEAEDLKKAGYNPALTAVGTNPGTGGAGGTAGTGITPAGLGNPIELALTLMQQENNNALTAAKVENTSADTITKTLNNKWINPKTKQEIAESVARTARERTASDVNETQAELNRKYSAESTARTAKTYSEEKEIRQGMPGKMLGTDMTSAIKKLVNKALKS